MTTPKQDIKNFKSELKALMLKYNILSIGWDCSDSSDTQGIYGEKMVACHKENWYEEVICTGGEIEPSDLETPCSEEKSY